MHIECVHEKKKRFSCNTCDLKFSTNSFLQKHIRTQHLGEKNYHCLQCNEAFKYSSNLVQHTRTVHEGIKYKCELCGSQYGSTNALLRHKKDKHGFVSISFQRKKLQSEENKAVEMILKE